MTWRYRYNKSNDTFLGFNADILSTFRQRLSAPINLVMEQEWKEKYRPGMEDAAEEADDDDEEDESEFPFRSDDIEGNRHKYSLWFIVMAKWWSTSGVGEFIPRIYSEVKRIIKYSYYGHTWYFSNITL